MTLPRSRNRDLQRRAPGPSAAVAVVPPSRRARGKAKTHAESGWPAPWMPWAVGIALVLAGAMASFLTLYILARPAINHTVATPAAGTPPELANSAEVVGPEPTATVAPGEQVELSWDVLNTSAGTWRDYDYRFAPADGQATPVVTLPQDVGPGDRVTVRARVTAPATEGTWRPAWDLTGPGGPVTGGHLSALVTVTQSDGP